MAATLFLRLLILLLVRANPNKTVEHPIGAQIDVLYSFVVNSHRGRKELGSELPKPHILSLSELRIDNSHWNFKGIPCINFLIYSIFTPFLASSKIL